MSDVERIQHSVIICLGGIYRTKYSGSIGIHGRILRIAKNRMSKVLRAKRVLRHSLLLDVSSKSVLVHESIPFTERVLCTLVMKHHITVGDIHVHLCVRGACYEGSLIEWILFNSFALTERT